MGDSLSARVELLPDTERKQAFSRAYSHAVLSAAGLMAENVRQDFDKVDVRVGARTGRGVVTSPRLDLQLKATATDQRGDSVVCRLSAADYDALRDPKRAVPIILVVVVVPEDYAEWVRQSEQELAVRHCGYWVSLRDREPVSHDSVTVHLPRSQVFSREAVAAIVERIQAGGTP